MAKAILKKMTATVLALIIAVSALGVASVTAASAAETNGQNMIVYNQDFYNRYSDAIEAVAEGIRNYQEEIVIKNYDFPLSATQELLEVLVYCYPELFWLDSIQYNYYQGSSYVYAIFPVYLYDEATSYEMKAEFEQCADKYLEKINAEMSDFEKALVLHDEIILNSSYLLDTDVYDLMVNKVGRCYSYAGVYSYLLSRAGIKTEQVTTPSGAGEMNHQWTKVLIDGEWYNVDVTWDDPSPDALAEVQHTYFLLSDSKIQSIDHYNYSISNPATSTKYDECVFHESNTKVWFDGDYCYFVDNMCDVDYEHSLLKYNYVTDETEKLCEINEYWDKKSTANGFSYAAYSYSGLAVYDGIFYLNTPTSVYTFDPQTGAKTVFNDSVTSEQIFGLILDGNQLYAAVAPGRTDDRVLVLAGTCPEQRVEFLRGDVDGDGMININDSTEIQRSVVNIITLTPSQKAAADIDGDGEITVNDATLIQKYIANVVNIL